MLEPTEPPLITDCRLDIDGLRRQRDRYRALGAQVSSARRQRQQLEVRFDTGVDVDLLIETIEVERECCPFFEMQLQLERRELVITVQHPEQDPALDAIIAALDASHPIRRRAEVATPGI